MALTRLTRLNTDLPPGKHIPQIMAIHTDNFVLANPLIEQIIRTPGRAPSPQPTRFGTNGANNNINADEYNACRARQSSTIGYIAPKFAGRKAQMETGQ